MIASSALVLCLSAHYQANSLEARGTVLPNNYLLVYRHSDYEIVHGVYRDCLRYGDDLQSLFQANLLSAETFCTNNKFR